MKIKITEQQQERLTSYDKVQKIFFKYWDKSETKADDLFFKLFNFTNVGLEAAGLMVSRNDAYRMLIKWYGDGKAKSKATEILKQKNFTVNLCGGYNFDFEIVHYKIIDDTGVISVIVRPEINGGTVDFIMIDGKSHTLKDAINNIDYGHEVEEEMSDCIYELLSKKITETIGYEIGIDRLIYD